MRRFDFDEVDDLQPSRMEAALGEAEDEVCDGSGEIHFNKSWGQEPWNDESYACPGCPNCEPEEGDDA
jgi:hypothetical protein